jgi:hypothetical protein
MIPLIATTEKEKMNTSVPIYINEAKIVGSHSTKETRIIAVV